MKNVEKVAFLVRDQEQVWECSRSALGLGVENMTVGLFIIGAEIDVAGREEALTERLEMISDLDGEIFSNVQENVQAWEFIQPASLEEIAERLKGYDLVVTF